MDALSDAVWGDVLEYVRAHHATVARGWFSRLRPGPLSSGNLTIYVAKSDQLEYMEAYCVGSFVEAAQAATGRLVSVTFSLAAAPSPPRGVESERVSFQNDGSLARLNPEYQFEHFVVGPSNQLAHASCLAAGENPGRAYNPLFLHGAVGLGKTHLLQAVCHQILDDAPASKITYLSCETFINHFVEAIERGAIDTFRYRYRHADALVIDDMQFLSGHERTQDEFFHTFNTLYQVQKQIILSADCAPSELPRLEERLISRFNWGLVARIDAPSLETRLAIVRKKARLRGIDLPDEVTMLVATRIKTNTRELEGAITRIGAMGALNNGVIDRALAEEALVDHVAPPPPEVRIQDIMSVVTGVFGVKLSDLQGRRRSRSIAFPRQVCMYLARQLTRHSLEEIGGFFGGRDHTTVLHANKLVSRRRENDVEFRSRLESIVEDLRQD
ncbi:MAG: chromosomal replication initiator protein DnaA [Planctomycetota bacterium]|nr:chromosomal replication initiator protein DnaA [Planctomycetota bacterium]MCZ6698688.1 chromosomal replication initiator protein DnaA [Planctomycetota bacterium]